MDSIGDNKYSKGKIYKITDVGYNKCYIGSTCESLSQRMARHRHNYKQFLNGNHGCSTAFLIFGEFSIDNCKIELLETYPCNSKEELERREGYFIKKHKCINKVVAGRTAKELYDDTHEHQLKRFHEYYINNRDKVLQRKATKMVCICGATIATNNISRHNKTKKHQEYLQQQSNPE